ncbi:MAG: acyltransferase family protein [Actinomycetales bacterium]|nr:acyltransferase family protein [Actinomycetales bacterium]
MTRAKVSALDAVRAVAILAVLTYHLDIPQAPGGFLGVDVFFVLSGYLITWILISEVRKRGRLDFRHFYVARARRLVPAFVGVVFALCIVASLFAPDTIPKFFDDLPWASTGTVNWWYVFNETSYFEETARPPLLQHTWSLAVETQFYLVWPLVVAFCARRAWLTGMRWFAVTAAAGFAALSISLGLHIEQASALQASNFYFGTGSRCVGLLLGAALAAGWTPQRLTSAVAPRARLFIDLVAVFALVSLVYLFNTVDEVTLHWFAWASPLASVATAAVIATLVHPASRVARALSRKPLLWLGTRSYGIYLWHWPVFQMLRPGIDVAWPGWATAAMRLVLTGAIAEASYRWLEMPVRQGRNPFAPLLNSYRNPQTRRFVAASVTAILLYPALALSRDAYATAKVEERGFLAQLNPEPAIAAGPTTRAEEGPATPAPTSEPALPLAAATHLLAPAPQPTRSPTATASSRPVAAEPKPGESAGTPAPAATATANPPTSAPTTDSSSPPAADGALALARENGVWVVGDSVLVGAARELRSRVPLAQMDAKVGLQANVLLHTIIDHRSTVDTGVVVMNIGNNGTIRERTLRKILAVLSDRTVVLVDARVPRRWQDANNSLVAEVAGDFPNVNLVRWSRISAGRPHYFSHDGIHLTATGAREYVDAIMDALARN